MIRISLLALTAAAVSISAVYAQTQYGGQTQVGGTPGGPAATAGTRGASGYQTSAGIRGSAGRLGTNHPNAAAGPIRSSGATQTGLNGRGNRARTPADPPLSRALPVTPALPLAPVVPLEGSAEPAPDVMTVEGAALPPDGSESVPQPAGATVTARPRVLPPIGAGDSAQGDDLSRATRGKWQVVAPLTGDLAFGLQPRDGGAVSRALQAQQRLLRRLAAAEAPPTPHVARRPASTPQPGMPSARDESGRSPTVQWFGGRWWYRTTTGGWLVWDAPAHTWVAFRPGALGHL